MPPEVSDGPKNPVSLCNPKDFAGIDRSDIDRKARLEGRLFNYDDAPPWTKDNDKILSGYRPGGSLRYCLKSCFSLHNESMNIWTHFAGLAFFLGITVYFFSGLFPSHASDALSSISKGLHRGFPSVPWRNWLVDLNSTSISSQLDHYMDSAKLNAKEVEARMHALWDSLSAFGVSSFPRFNLDNQSAWIDPLVVQVFALHEELTFHQIFLSIFLFSAMLCLGFSSVFHCFLCYSCHASAFLVKLDYVGIALLICGSGVPAIYYGFYCMKHLQTFYLSFSVLSCVITIYVSMQDRFSTFQYRGLRAATFIGSGMSGLFPVIHMLFIGLEGNWISAQYILLMGFLYVSGALMFAFRFPEIYFPGRHDIWFHSHQWMHICVVAAAFIHWMGLLELLKIRLQTPCVEL